MKTFLTIVLFSATVCSFAQSRKFSNVEDYEAWLMNYYKNPQPHYLFDGFNYGIHNKKVEKSGGRSMVIGFFSSCLRKDTIMQQAFYEKIIGTKDRDLIFGFALILWYTHTDFSLTLLDTFQRQDNIKKYTSEFDQLKAEKFIDIWVDPISHPELLDMLWTDFFATGNEESIKRIISKLADLSSGNQFDMVTAGSAKWSLASNAIHHQKVLDVCKREKETSDPEISKALGEIIEVVRQKKGGG